jgi:hypothetical protein
MIHGLEDLITDEDETGVKKNLREALAATETHILSASKELKDMVVESGSMAESLFERVDTGYKELETEIKGLANVEQVLLDTADSVMDTKRKIEFGVQQIIFKVTELVAISGGEMDDNLAAKFESITRTILSNQTQALATLTIKVPAPAPPSPPPTRWRRRSGRCGGRWASCTASSATPSASWRR